jgi:hypothetical protein
MCAEDTQVMLHRLVLPLHLAVGLQMVCGAEAPFRAQKASPWGPEMVNEKQPAVRDNVARQAISRVDMVVNELPQGGLGGEVHLEAYPERRDGCGWFVCDAP